MPKTLAGVLCVLYLMCAALAFVDDFRRKPSPLILPDATTVVAFPGLVVVMLLAEPFGFKEVNSRNWYPVHVAAVLVTAALVYLLGAAAGWLLVTVAGWLAPAPLR